MSASKLSSHRVLLLGAALISIGVFGFATIPGMIVEGASGPRLVNAFYCAVITLATIGFGDICPGDTNDFGKLFLVLYAFCGLGAFCGPVMDLASTWKVQLPGGWATLATFTIGLGAGIFILEGFSQGEAIYASFITGTTIGYGAPYTPASTFGKVAIALYAILSVNVIAGLLAPARTYLCELCRAKDNIKLA